MRPVCHKRRNWEFNLFLPSMQSQSPSLGCVWSCANIDNSAVKTCPELNVLRGSKITKNRFLGRLCVTKCILFLLSLRVDTHTHTHNVIYRINLWKRSSRGSMLCFASQMSFRENCGTPKSLGKSLSPSIFDVPHAWPEFFYSRHITHTYPFYLNGLSYLLLMFGNPVWAGQRNNMRNSYDAKFGSKVRIFFPSKFSCFALKKINFSICSFIMPCRFLLNGDVEGFRNVQHCILVD